MDGWVNVGDGVGSDHVFRLNTAETALQRRAILHRCGLLGGGGCVEQVSESRWVGWVVQVCLSVAVTPPDATQFSVWVRVGGAGRGLEQGWVGV